MQKTRQLKPLNLAFLPVCLALLYLGIKRGFEPLLLVPIGFEFNKYRIQSSAKPTLEGIAQLLKDNGDWKILVEGHCDERGTHEYNLSLGEQRALSTKRYLVSLGIGESRFQTISYGEERPLDPRSTEAAWEKNRRAEFRVQAPQS